MRFKIRLTLAFGLFAFLLCALFALLLEESLTTVEDQIVTSLLTQEANYLAARYQENPDMLVMPDLEQLKGYRSGQADFPAWLAPLETGFHQSRDFHVLVRELDSEQRIYLVYDETNGILEQHEDRVSIILVLLVLIVSVVGIGLGFYQAKLLARPVEKLVAQVEKVDAVNPEIVPLASNDEIGLLSRAYASLVDRLGQYIQREKAFTRYASHELMTPLAIINNNLELLRHESVDAGMQARAMDRLHDAANHMQRQIEVFLMLAREGQIEPASQALDWNRLWDDIQASFPRVSLSLEIVAEPEVYANEAAVQVVLFNILGNIEKHGAQQPDTVNAVLTLDNHSLNVRNAISRSERRASPRYGFGLEINEKLCAAIGWHFATSQENNQFSVTIRFDSDDESKA